MRNSHRTIFLLILALLSVIDVNAQSCGNDFKTIKVTDTKGKSISNLTIEIVAQLPREDYKDLDYHKIIKIPVSDAKAAIKRNLPKTFSADIQCKNPLKQKAGKTKVKNIDEQKPPSTEYLGFCTAETLLEPLLLKVSAPGYLTDYYLGNFFGGCSMTYELVLLKKSRKF